MAESSFVEPPGPVPNRTRRRRVAYRQYDADQGGPYNRDLNVSVDGGMPQDMVANDGNVPLVNPPGTVHTLTWIGVNRWW
jgi:hypothetical protein